LTGFGLKIEQSHQLFAWRSKFLAGQSAQLKPPIGSAIPAGFAEDEKRQVLEKVLYLGIPSDCHELL
jgi:hypothetical protein